MNEITKSDLLRVSEAFGMSPAQVQKKAEVISDKKVFGGIKLDKSDYVDGDEWENQNNG